MDLLPSEHVLRPPGCLLPGAKDGHLLVLLSSRGVTGGLVLLHPRLGRFGDPQGFVCIPSGHGLYCRLISPMRPPSTGWSLVEERGAPRGLYEEVGIIPEGSRSKATALIAVGPRLCGV